MELKSNLCENWSKIIQQFYRGKDIYVDKIKPVGINAEQQKIY